jgi:AcrR family transcriptional regulator
MGTAPVEGQRLMRADARRNYARLVDAAREAFTEHGAQAPLDEIARRAGVGPGTLYRHFPTREALIEAVFRGDVEELCAQAYQLLETHRPGEALAGWMRAQVAYVQRKRGLGAAMVACFGVDTELFEWCRQRLWAAGDALLDACRQVGAVRPDVKAPDLLRLGHGVAVATERAPEDTGRLLSVVLDGLRHGGAPDPR